MVVDQAVVQWCVTFSHSRWERVLLNQYSQHALTQPVLTQTSGDLFPSICWGLGLGNKSLLLDQPQPYPCWSLWSHLRTLRSWFSQTYWLGQEVDRLSSARWPGYVLPQTCHLWPVMRPHKDTCPILSVLCFFDLPGHSVCQYGTLTDSTQRTFNCFFFFYFSFLILKLFPFLLTSNAL